jgi:hypothetical protein
MIDEVLADAELFIMYQACMQNQCQEVIGIFKKFEGNIEIEDRSEELYRIRL